MKITILCSSASHPVNTMLHEWIDRRRVDHEILLVRSARELACGDILFLFACDEIINEEYRRKFTKTLIVHASDLPKGRGWSPQIWSILDGADTLRISLFEAEDKVDSGDIWKKVEVNIPRHALYDEINEILFNAEAELMDFALASFSKIKPEPQDPLIEPSYYRHRSPTDSELDPNETLVNQFDLQ